MGYGQLSVVLLVIFLFEFALSSSLCPKDQSISLVKFNETFTIDTFASLKSKTSSWNMSRDCCLWDGVKCDEMTGHVIELDLNNCCFAGKVDSNITVSNSLVSKSLIFPGTISPIITSRQEGLLRCGNADVSLFSNLKNLRNLDLSYNGTSLSSENKVNFTLPESLWNLALVACEVKELEFLRSAKQLFDLNLSNNKIQGRIPDWVWPIWMFSLNRLNLSHNMLTNMGSGNMDSIPSPSLYLIDLQSNFLQGSLPILPNSTQYLFLSNNDLSEEIPSYVCNLDSLRVLDLAKNNLIGEIPQCLANISTLEVLDMHQNNLSGTIPKTFTIGNSLRSLNLHDNKLQGKLPRSLANCKELQVLDLGNNHLGDTFPMWLATLPKLQVLSLRSNKLYGSIRTSRDENMFLELRILDVSYNAFTGNVPTSLFQQLKAMR
uniref:Probably inactive leucine-rich repeat receptor-like protein kinase At3g28040 n=1 Tax=Nicotiana tabacum TaxID=4097 RepID=A0A1S4AFK6_TOBAC